MALVRRLVVVTGGAQGIGRAIVQGFAAEGHAVVAADIDQEAGAALERDAAAADWGAGGGRVKFVAADFADTAAACADVTARAQEWAGTSHVDVLVNNVGVQSDNGNPVHLLSEEAWDRVQNVNVKSYFLMAKLCLPGMLQNGRGCIVNVGSVQGRQSQVGIPSYAASKGAVASLTRQMAIDYSASGIRTVCVSPGTIRTPLVERIVEQDGHNCEELGQRYPLGRMGAPEDVANLCVFLASDKARNITGVDFACDGGIMAMGSWDQRVGLGSYLNAQEV